MISVHQAKKILKRHLLEHGKGIQTETIPLPRAVGRILAEPIKASFPIPSFDNSAMDGYALKSETTLHAACESPVSYRILGAVRAGETPPTLYQDDTVYKIMTGAPIPNGADAVIKKEETRKTSNLLLVSRPVAAEEHVRRQGGDLQPGNEAVSTGTRLTPGICGLISSLGLSQVTVCQIPKVSLIVTGHELVSAGSQPKPGQIFDSNSTLLTTALQELGIQPIRLLILGDNPKQIQTNVHEALTDSDLLVISGGVSVGDYDCTKEVLEELEVKQLFWRVAQKPGKPLYMGWKDSCLVAGLPGNPLSVFNCYYLYLRSVLLHRMGAKETELRWSILPITKTVQRQGERAHFLKGRVVDHDGITMAEPLSGQESHRLASLVQTNILIYLPKEVDEVPRGNSVKVFHLPF